MKLNRIRKGVVGPAFLISLAGSVRAETIPPPVTQPGFAGLIGVAREDITPPVGIFSRNWGAAKHDVAETIHRPFTATVLSIQARKEDPPLLLAALDLGWWRTKEDEEFVRLPLVRELARDSSRVIVNLSHTHAGPSICREDREKPGGHLIDAYLTKVRDVLISAARKAVAGAVPATLEWRYGCCDLATNRDLPDPHRERIVTGYNPSRPADDTLLVGRVTDTSGKVLATVVNYACHPTIVAWDCKVLSPDYVSAMRSVVELATEAAPCLFLQGNSGELAPRDTYANDPEVADRNGTILGYSALSTLAAMLPPRSRLEYAGVVESGAPLGTWKRVPDIRSTVLEVVQVDVDFKLKPLPSSVEIERQMNIEQDRVKKERLLRNARVRRIVGEGASASIPLWAWRVGDAIILAQPSEAYSDLQLALRQAHPGRPVVSTNLSNGSIGYLCPMERHALDIYQVWQSPFESGTLECLIESAKTATLRLLR